jgi:hypothetical protein
VTNFIEKAELVGFDGIQALEVLHRLHTVDYDSRRAGSKAANDSRDYHPSSSSTVSVSSGGL